MKLSSLSRLLHYLDVLSIETLDSIEPELQQRLLNASDPYVGLQETLLIWNIYLQQAHIPICDLTKQLASFDLIYQDKTGHWHVLQQKSPKNIFSHTFNESSQIEKQLSPKQLSRLFPEGFQGLLVEKKKLQPTPKLTPRWRLYELLKTEQRDLWLVVLYSLAMGILGLGIPIAIQSLVNTVAFGNLNQPMLVLSFLVLLVLSVLAFLRTLRLILVEILQRRLFVRVTQVSARRLSQILPSSLEQKRLPELVNRFFDVLTVQKSASFLLLDGLALLLQAVTGMALLAFYHPFLLGFDIFLLIGLMFILFVLGLGGEKTSIHESGKKYMIAAWLEEMAIHPMLFKSVSGRLFAERKIQNLLQQYLSARNGHFRVVLRQNIGAFGLQAVASACLLGLGGWLVIQGELTIGQLVAAELVVAGVVDSFSKMGKYLEVWYDLMAALDKLGYLFDLPQESERIQLISLEKSSLYLELKDISYSRAPHLKSFAHLNLKCPPGSKLAIYGANTWESDTFTNLIYGVYAPVKGLVLMNDLPLGFLSPTDYRSRVAIVKDIELIEASLFENLKITRQELSREQAQTYLQQVGLWDKVKYLPQGLDTRLSFNGTPLSLSDTYLLMVARALVSEPALIVMDGVLDQIENVESSDLLAYLLSSEQFPCTLILVSNKHELCKRLPITYTFQSGQLVEGVIHGHSFN